jgi:hypothetical protein
MVGLKEKVDGRKNCGPNQEKSNKPDGTLLFGHFLLVECTEAILKDDTLIPYSDSSTKRHHC